MYKQRSASDLQPTSLCRSPTACVDTPANLTECTMKFIEKEEDETRAAEDGMEVDVNEEGLDVVRLKCPWDNISSWGYLNSLKNIYLVQAVWVIVLCGFLGMIWVKVLSLRGNCDGVRPIEGVNGEHGLGFLVDPADSVVLHFGMAQGLSQEMPAPGANDNGESGMEVVNHEEFADVNGSGYKLEQPLGGSSPSLDASVAPEDQDREFSSADGTILRFEKVYGSRVEKVKGITSLDFLLGVERFDSGSSGSSEAKALTNPTADANANLERGMQVVNFEEFANVNGVKYILEKLLGRSSSGSEASTPTTEKRPNISPSTTFEPIPKLSNSTVPARGAYES
ncbi:hypothetical protein CPB83DRAFT_836899 [Crepidotus variabilis]|uniref:Uncharacterized protein n=1 Tax=Crepidotus variabilis TaxID=179855 RepID=A0A9P6EDY4_9AGAR|nr:hypothetical protein CPB83DRAFT_836899 [Crepidotus variabilis]